MGKFFDGFEQARLAQEARDAEARRRAELTAAALKALTEKLGEDGEMLKELQITMRIEHGALVLKRRAQPLAGVGFNPETSHFNIHEYSTAEGKTELEAESVDECAARLGEYVFSLQRGPG